uniref:Uncharacterized protein n=1 Tax=Strombidium inclinatum TaxID=197538 RepID=A0A7S3IF40_9SPIT|mmetsp:Transcript_11888/g.18359  ORF Transcript_11888/g.18359 Transcript_11888/m.18359 type:complete len:101 (+) Transcript_11888:2-304(+)
MDKSNLNSVGTPKLNMSCKRILDDDFEETQAHQSSFCGEHQRVRCKEDTENIDGLNEEGVPSVQTTIMQARLKRPDLLDFQSSIVGENSWYEQSVTDQLA